ncbi:hypothetical protein H6B11_14945 [Mediterraneibacter glycyrrhizinilyticus]|nr:hypothetical protein [Mediterraneibacter glycyrrhizinilyticus]
MDGLWLEIMDGEGNFVSGNFQVFVDFFYDYLRIRQDYETKIVFLV